MKKVLVLFSGGLDSAVTTALYKNLGYDVYTLYIYYGNINYNLEYEKSQKVLDKLNIPEENRFIYSLHPLCWSNSKCINDNTSNHYYYVEARNFIFISIALSIAESKKIPKIALGFINTLSEYSDTSEEFITSFNNLAVNTLGIEIEAPLKQLNKTGVYKLGKKFGIKLKDTISCNFAKDKPCGECYDCVDLKNLIKELNIPDDENPFI